MKIRGIRGFEFCKKYVDGNKTELPVRGTPESAGYDFFSPIEVTILPGNTAKIETGIKAYMQPGEVLLLFPRSSYGIEKGMVLANTTGIIDADYYNNQKNEGNIIIAIRNEGQIPFTIHKGDRFAQGVFVPFLTADNAKTLNENRSGGLGSTNS